MSLLDKALEKKVPAGQRRSASGDELELAVAFFHGRINSQQVGHALGHERATGAPAWAARMLQLALADGRCSLTIREPQAGPKAGDIRTAEEREEDEADEKHEVAKAAPLSSLGRTVRR